MKENNENSNLYFLQKLLESKYPGVEGLLQLQQEIIELGQAVLLKQHLGLLNAEDIYDLRRRIIPENHITNSN
jgi:hypothetical protein